MSIVQFKQAAFKKESQLREKRVDFATMIPSLKQFGIQEVKRKRDDNKSGGRAVTTTTTTRTPPRGPRGPYTQANRNVQNLVSSSDEDDSLDLQPYRQQGTIRSTIITSLIYKNQTGKAFCWKLQDYRRGRSAMFPNITKMFFFPGGNIFEDEVLDHVQEAIGTPIQRQYQQGGAPDLYERDAIERMRQNRFTYIQRLDGFTNQISDDLALWGKKVICRADGLTDTHVIEVKVPFGSLYKVYQSGFTEYEEDGIMKKKFNPDDEIFTVPPHYMCQLLFEMNTFKRKKAYFGQYYSFRNWISLFNHLILQYDQVMKKYPFQRGTVVYRPCLDKTTPLNTIMKRAITIVQEAYTDTDNPRQKKEKRQRAANYMRQFWTEYCGLPELPEQVEEASAEEQEDFIERNWRGKNNEMLNSIIENTTKENLLAFGVSPYQAKKIEEVFRVGGGGDIQRGVVKPNNMVLWDGENEEMEFPDSKTFISGLKLIMKRVIARVSRKNKDAWDPFERALTKEDVIDMELYPRNDSAYDEFVLLEVDLTDKYEEVMAKLKEFLRNLERIDQDIINCKGKKGGKKWMIGKNGIREDFIQYLSKIPVKKVFKKEYPIYTWTMMRQGY